MDHSSKRVSAYHSFRFAAFSTVQVWLEEEATYALNSERAVAARASVWLVDAGLYPSAKERAERVPINREVRRQGSMMTWIEDHLN